MNCYYWFGVIFGKCKKVFDLNVSRLHTNGFYLVSVFIKVAFLPLHMNSTGATIIFDVGCVWCGRILQGKPVAAALTLKLATNAVRCFVVFAVFTYKNYAYMH